MRVYDNYKSTENEWLNEIPEHWNFLKLRAFGRLQTSSIDKKLVEGEELINLLNYTDVYNSKDKWLDSDIEFMKVTAKPEQIKNNSVKDGDVFFTPSSEIIEEIGYSAVAKKDLENTCYSYHLLRLRFNSFGKSKALKSYRRFLFNNEFVLNQFSKGAKGTTRKILNLNEFKDAVVPVPTIPEQTQIVKYLDYKTGLIDDFIASRKKQIDLLREQLRKKMFTVLTRGLTNTDFKATDLPWFPEIPVNWEMYKFNAAIKLLHGFQFRDNHFREQGVKVVKITQLKADGTLDLSEASLVDEAFLTSLKKKIIKNGDILMALTGGTIGKIIRVEDLDEEVLQNYRVGKFIPKDNRVLDKDFMFWVLSSEFTYAQILFLQRETGQPNIGIGDFSKMFFPMPNTLEEQREIVEYIVEQKTETDSLVSKYQKQIELMQEYRTAIISQTVTGKIDVREWQPKAKELKS